MELLTYTSSVTGTQRRCRLYVPNDPFSRKPELLLFVLHGIGGDENEWLAHGNPGSILDALVSCGAVPPLVALFPNGRACENDAPPENLFEPYAIEGFGRFGDELVHDLVPLAHRLFEIDSKAENRILCGLSMGGGQTLNIGLSNPDFFSCLAAFSPAPNTDIERSLVAARKGASGSEAALHRFTPVWLCCGHSDDLLHVTRNAEQALSDAGIPVKTEYIEGGHDWNVWNYGLRNSLQFFYKDEQ